MKGPCWAPEHVETVRRHYGRLPVSMIARATGRSESAVRNQAASLGMRTGAWKEWTTSDLAYLRAAYLRRGAIFVAVQLRRSVDSVRQKACELGMGEARRAAGLNVNGRRLWSADEDAQLVASPLAELPALAQRLDRTLKAATVRRGRVMRRAVLAVPQGP